MRKQIYFAGVVAGAAGADPGEEFQGAVAVGVHGVQAFMNITISSSIVRKPANRGQILALPPLVCTALIYVPGISRQELVADI